MSFTHPFISTGHTHTDHDKFEVFDRVPEKTLLLSLHHNTNSTNTNTNSTELPSCAQPAWAQEHVGTIVASAVALLLLGVVVALLGCITGYWRRVKLCCHGNCMLPPTNHEVVQCFNACSTTK